MASPPYPSGNYTGYIPTDLLESFDKALYDSLGKSYPYHYWNYNGVRYKASYASPYTAISLGGEVLVAVTDPLTGTTTSLMGVGSETTESYVSSRRITPTSQANVYTVNAAPTPTPTPTQTQTPSPGEVIPSVPEGFSPLYPGYYGPPTPDYAKAELTGGTEGGAAIGLLACLIGGLGLTHHYKRRVRK